MELSKKEIVSVFANKKQKFNIKKSVIKKTFLLYFVSLTIKPVDLITIYFLSDKDIFNFN